MTKPNQYSLDYNDIYSNIPIYNGKQEFYGEPSVSRRVSSYIPGLVMISIYFVLFIISGKPFDIKYIFIIVILALLLLVEDNLKTQIV